MKTQQEITYIFPVHCSEQVIRCLVSQAAYYKAKNRGFTSGHDDEDWLEAEKEIKSCLRDF